MLCPKKALARGNVNVLVLCVDIVLMLRRQWQRGQTGGEGLEVHRGSARPLDRVACRPAMRDVVSRAVQPHRGRQEADEARAQHAGPLGPEDGQREGVGSAQLRVGKLLLRFTLVLAQISAKAKAFGIGEHPDIPAR